LTLIRNNAKRKWEELSLNTDCDNNEHILATELSDYTAQGLYPFHMPGHKRNVAPAPGLPYDWDLTEVEGVDNLHEAEGILKEAMDRTARLYGVKRTWYLVNGSTVGLLSAIRACVPFGGEIIAARNCHKAVYHAIELNHLRVHWLYPEYLPSYSIYGSVRPESVQALLQQFPDTRAVVITSPTYEGILSGIASIAKICHVHHSKAIPLIVDEAHGAHLGLYPGFPDSAVHCGADLVIQSAHKTLPSLTQTAFLHMPEGSIADPDEVDRQLNIFETSSPSYPLMASLDGCTGILRTHGWEMYARWRAELDRFAWMVKDLRHLRVLGRRTVQTNSIFAYDDSKILISGDGCTYKGEPVTGRVLADSLRRHYRIETEMHLGGNVLCMTSMCDEPGRIEELGKILLEIDSLLADGERTEKNRRTSVGSLQYDGWHSGAVHKDASSENTGKTDAMKDGTDSVKRRNIDVREMGNNSALSPMTIADAVSARAEYVSADSAVGRIAAEYVYCYPPGIPSIVPGEVITQEEAEQLRRFSAEGTASVHHSRSHDKGKFAVVAEADQA